MKHMGNKLSGAVASQSLRLSFRTSSANHERPARFAGSPQGQENVMYDDAIRAFREVGSEDVDVNISQAIAWTEALNRLDAIIQEIETLNGTAQVNQEAMESLQLVIRRILRLPFVRSARTSGAKQ